MEIEKLTVENFRCISNESIEIGSLTALIGRNGSGKSSFLRALKIFYTTSADIGEGDFFNGNTEKPIAVTIEFGCFTESEKEEFGEYITGGQMKVTKEIEWEEGYSAEAYYGYKPKNPDFDKVREGEYVDDRREVYFELYESGDFPGLPKHNSSVTGTKIEETLREWEEDHPDALETRRDDGSYFSKNNKIGRRTKYIYVPAVRDASKEASEGRDAAIAEIMDVVVRNALSQHQDIVDLRKETQRKYDQIVEEQSKQELARLGEEMSATMSLFAPDTKISLDWQPQQSVEIEMPQAKVRLIEDGYGAGVERAGHGAQRAFILTALQHLINHQDGNDEVDEDAELHLILAIEEPELYQHPSRQRHLAKVLAELAASGVAGISKHVQIIYSTHSPLFVNTDRFDDVRLLQKRSNESVGCQHTHVRHTDLGKAARIEEKAKNETEGTFTAGGFRARIGSITTPRTNEGFFASHVVLVEGVGDRAALTGAANALEHDFDRLDVALIPCQGKSKIVKLASVFRALEIPLYCVWDSDRSKVESGKANKSENHTLLRFHGDEAEDYTNVVTETYACFEEDLEESIKGEIGADLYGNLLDDCRTKFGYNTRKEARKNPAVIRHIFDKATEEGQNLSMLENIVESIVASANVK